MKYDNRIIDFICDNLLPLVWFFVTLFCIFLCSYLPVNAAGDQDYFPMQQNNNSKFSSDLISSIESRFDTENNNVFVYFVNYNPSQGYGRYNYYYTYFPKNSDTMMYGEIYNNLYNWSIYWSVLIFIKALFGVMLANLMLLLLFLMVVIISETGFLVLPVIIIILILIMFLILKFILIITLLLVKLFYYMVLMMVLLLLMVILFRRY